ncbi:response regulator transcription factor [Nitrosomonas sp.]|uniref:helix-turn-helix transcriptional regulator n=1 Tax=Nitrosomonas sp. TaxID=42353 RepID=UPI0027256D63|nr:response regulator transcription factor [Nitrosomonas sp.]MDO8893875.1 response regulator transcription factor [Nitrosomonas sp.]
MPDTILVISENTDQAAGLAKRYSSQGYRVFNMLPAADLDVFNIEHLELILLVDCPWLYIPVTKYLKQHSNGNHGIQVICMSDRIRSGQLASENFHSDDILPEPSSLPADFAFPERRRNDRRQKERRKSLQCLEQTPASHAGVAGTPLSADNSDTRQAGLIHLQLITDNMHLGNQLQSYFSGSASSGSIDCAISSFKQTFDQSKDFFPDTILFDMGVSDDTAIEQIGTIREKAAAAKIILLAGRKHPDIVHEIIKFRISGFLPVDASYALYEKAVAAVHKGEFWLPHWLINRMLTISSNRQKFSGHFLQNGLKLTDCEQKAAELVVQGLSNKQIAQRLAVSPETVKKQLKAVFEKSGVSSRNQLTALYISLLGDLK